MSVKQTSRAFPLGIDLRRDCPQHIKEFKQEIFDCFKNATGEVTSTDEELSTVKGVRQPLILLTPLLAVTTSGSYIIAPSPAYTSLISGDRFTIRADAVSIVGQTITVNSLTPYEIVYSTGDQLPDAHIPAGAFFEVVFNATSSKFQLMKLS